MRGLTPSGPGKGANLGQWKDSGTREKRIKCGETSAEATSRIFEKGGESFGKEKKNSPEA